MTDESLPVTSITIGYTGIQLYVINACPNVTVPPVNPSNANGALDIVTQLLSINRASILDIKSDLSSVYIARICLISFPVSQSAYSR